MANEDNQKLQEMQFLEQNIQNIIMQKQAFQSELSETESAIEETEKSGDEVYKLIGQLMIKTDKSKIKDELTNKKKLLGLRIQSLDKQENSLREKMEDLRNQSIDEDKKEN